MHVYRCKTLLGGLYVDSWARILNNQHISLLSSDNQEHSPNLWFRALVTNYRNVRVCIPRYIRKPNHEEP